jgi:hypothetical protein
VNSNNINKKMVMIIIERVGLFHLAKQLKEKELGMRTKALEARNLDPFFEMWGHGKVGLGRSFVYLFMLRFASVRCIRTVPVVSRPSTILSWN